MAEDKAFKWRLLLVDDEPDIRLIVRTALEPKYEILEAHDGVDALEKIRRYEPDFVVLDVMMPVMDGFQACEMIRNTPAFQNLPVMFLTALDKREDIKKGYGAGANLYLTKPFDPSRLGRNIDVFFETNPVPRRHRRYTIEQIREFEEKGTTPAAPGSGYYTPVSSSSAHAVPASEDLPAAPLVPRLMVVDDDLEIIEMVKLAVTGIVEVVSATDGLKAIEKLVRYQPDFLLIDIMLPRMNGFQLCQSLRSNKAFGRIPIIVSSGRTADRDVNFAKRVGANDFLAKPYKPIDLMEKLKLMQKLPGFVIHPKTMTMQQVEELENPDGKGAFANEKNANPVPDERLGIGVKDSSKAINQFLRHEGTKEALDHVEGEKKEEAPRTSNVVKRLFGFGGKQ